MSNPSKIKTFFFKNLTAIFLTVAFFVWYFSLREFFEGKYWLMGDANVYYEHFRFYIDQIGKGVYPLWDPSRDCGVPAEFYLRRMGTYNPFLFLILFFVKLGIPHKIAYFTFLAGYYFLGMIGFFFLSKSLFKDSRLAFIAFLLLMYSTLFSLLFNSFIVLVFTPMFWFYFFVLEFSRQQHRLFLFGAVFCLMILFQTYIPFYFLSILFVILILTVCIYLKEFLGFLSASFQFLRNDKIFSLICILLVLLSIVPGYLFFKEGAAGEFVMPNRHGVSDIDNSLSVPMQTTATGGVMAINFAQDLFADYSKIRLGNFYIPIFVHVLILLGIFIAIDRFMIFLSLLIFAVYCLSVYGAGPVYKFLYENVFFFKYFRNFQFFLWLVMLPGYILIGVAHLRVFVRQTFTERSKIVYSILIFLIHISFGFILLRSGNRSAFSYLTLFLSLVFFWAFFNFKFSKEFYEGKHLRDGSAVCFLVFVLFLTAVQPIRIYQDLMKNSIVQTDPYRYEFPKPYDAFVFSPDSYADPRPIKTYYSTKWFRDFYENIPVKILNEYLGHKLRVYDGVQLLSDDPSGYRKLEAILKGEDNLAGVFLSTDKENALFADASKGFGSLGQKIFIPLENSPVLEVLHYDVNSISIKTNFERPKFIVYNDCFYRGWQIFVNKKEGVIFRSNGAFKGFFIPAGESVVFLRFSGVSIYLGHWVLGVIYLFSLVYLLILFKDHAFKKDQNG